jgi:hypothetical protein
VRRTPAPVPVLAIAAALALVAVAMLALDGCGGGSGGDSESSTPSATESEDESSMPSAPQSPETEPPAARPDRATAQTVASSHCPADLSGCRTTKGRIVYVERVDPDGDGDAHFVVADPQSITLPGLTVIDVRAGLRPQPLPGPGDLISAAGQVQTGSYGQSQIHAVEVHAGVPRTG